MHPLPSLPCPACPPDEYPAPGAGCHLDQAAAPRSQAAGRLALSPFAASGGFESVPARLAVISGGQTGVDRAALDAAMSLGLACGGFCPKGRRAMDGRIPDRYPLSELPEFNYLARTSRNIQAAHATLVVNLGPLSGGTLATWRLALREPGSGGRPKPLFLASLDGLLDPLDQTLGWLCGLAGPGIILNVAGPSERKVMGIESLARDFLTRLFTAFAEKQGLGLTRTLPLAPCGPPSHETKASA